MTTSTVHTAPSTGGDSAFDRACRLIQTELGGRRIAPEPEHWLDQLVRNRHHKTAFITAVRRHCLVSGVVEACRVVEAVYPYLDTDGGCTDAAVDAAWRILEPEAHRWSEDQQDTRRSSTGECLADALTEADAAVA
ncbi:hypothetical protein OHS18_13540 [Amycolatopsis sp. NBC_00355]|uniref:hypothetical protein n=1 Tax=Amycolatopsis sp. NBC_00355 TaxID=2975957 RepID=UPI002E268E7E